jgi:choline dehydrogenase-like flavoprotein
VYTRALAKKIQFDANKRATGVQVEVSDMKFHLNATREIILCAGALQSPQLLMVSGVGPSTTVNQHQIPVVADRPGVGQNMWVSTVVSIDHMPVVNVDRTIHSQASAKSIIGYYVLSFLIPHSTIL